MRARTSSQPGVVCRRAERYSRREAPLDAFRRVHLAAGAAATLTFSLGAERLAMVDLDGHTSLHAGNAGVLLAGHGPELRARAREGAEPAAAQDVPKVVVIAQ